MRIVVRGIVQGVGFRPTVHRVASAMGLSGYVQNNGSSVAIVIDGDADEFMHRLREALPPLARLDSVTLAEEALPEGWKGFRIIPSSEGVKGVGIPTDTAVCDRCLEEMFDPGDRRYLYPFTSCTDCGARFTVIEDLPYDRRMTSMEEFPRCPLCEGEYSAPGERRFHHQTVTCPRCGPSYHVLDAEGSSMEGDPIATFARMLEEGGIGVAKSWGGMHICSTLDSLPRLREWYRRREKPFAVMVRDMEALRRYGRPTAFEEGLLRSPHRPIVLVDRTENEANDLIAPGLGKVGLFLPYTGMHHILFHHMKVDALVMTSANVPGEPMVLRDEDIMELGAEAYLLHDRRIVNRADDSVLRAYGERTHFIRRSRGHTPSFIDAPFKGRAVGLGAQENLSGAVASDGRLYTTQHIGDGDSLGVVEFLEEAVAYLRRLLGVDELQAVAMDLHPAFGNRRLARRIAEEEGAELLEVQHHWAHAASLMAESGKEEMVAIAVDGTGYGEDGNAWGGEILHATYDGYERLAHLQEIPLLGGERAVVDVRRLVLAMCEMNGRECGILEEGDATVLRKLMPRSVRTTSMGRVLDAIACQLGICSLRSYDGEPAMKLERHLASGRRTMDIPFDWEGDTLLTVPAFDLLMDAEGKRGDIAHSYVAGMVEAMADRAAEEADALGIEAIGLTGGVSYNSTITRLMENRLSERGRSLVLHDRVPNGDGGVSVGQCAIALKAVDQ